ncbi:hypothetical protein KZ813_06025 [Sphingomonas sp. RHCKR7]|uniref:hypothetical protein n=1 Tax=Sphingomonas folli TaxID=2862497 RepID=UPI001CA5EC3C|nr:hypothetical protein [Sphingomonas folli]MBW6526392.1 hypothetical protein [Sphingomonas folli]
MEDPVSVPTSDELAGWTDQELLTEWMKLTYESHDPRLDLLAAEVERRGLDF